MKMIDLLPEDERTSILEAYVNDTDLTFEKGKLTSEKVELFVSIVRLTDMYQRFLDSPDKTIDGLF